MDGLITEILFFLTDLGYIGIALALMIEIIPSEIVLSYGGFLVSLGQIHFAGAVIAGTIGGVLSQLFLYWMGYFGGRPFLEKFGKYIFIKKKHLDQSEEWFNRYGPIVIFTARFIPLVRHAISIPAGIAKMSSLKFILYTTLAIIPWSILFIYLGSQIGQRWDEIKSITSEYILVIIVGVIAIISLYTLYTKKRRK